MTKYICVVKQNGNSHYLDVEQELVQCRDCRYRERHGTCEFFDFGTSRLKTKPDDFCSFGERKHDDDWTE